MRVAVNTPARPVTRMAVGPGPGFDEARLLAELRKLRGGGTLVLIFHLWESELGGLAALRRSGEAAGDDKLNRAALAVVTVGRSASMSMQQGNTFSFRCA